MKKGTNYTVLLSGRTSAGLGKSSNLTFETDISEPEPPEVSGMLVYNITDATAVLPLKLVAEVNGPISCLLCKFHDMGGQRGCLPVNFHQANQFGTIPGNVDTEIQVKDLLTYVIRKKKLEYENEDDELSVGLAKEYSSIPRDLIHPNIVATQPHNKGKNRYINITPYDQSRVVLQATSNKEDSDYINASYLDDGAFGLLFQTSRL
ncbi:UNVERIFIED_CONTAM: hypothetical protein FKN15_043898 [Acipenser sinensis]